MRKLEFYKDAIKCISIVYAIFATVFIWIDELFSKFFIKTSLTFLILLVVLSLFYYLEYWDSDSKKDKKDYFAN